jgi:hypothetical protein
MVWITCRCCRGYAQVGWLRVTCGHADLAWLPRLEANTSLDHLGGWEAGVMHVMLDGCR